MVSQLEALLLRHIRAVKLEQPVPEYRFHPTRRWRFDFAYPDRMIAIEVEGGTYSNGRHTRAKGYENDCEKYNEAEILGWKLLRFTGDMIKSGKAIRTLERAISSIQ